MIEHPTHRPDPIPDHLRIEVLRVDHRTEPSLEILHSRLKGVETPIRTPAHLLHRLDHVCDRLGANFNPATSRALLFARTRAHTMAFAELLRAMFSSRNMRLLVAAFHAGLSSEERLELYEQFLDGRLHVLVSTKAFGMGMDIPNIHFLAHLEMPTTLEDYLQEIGRAGRDRNRLKEAGYSADNPIRCLLYYSQDEINRSRGFLRSGRLLWNSLQDVQNSLFKLCRLVRGNLRTGLLVIPLEAAKFDGLNDLTDGQLRMALHWLEALKRIRLGHFVPPYLSFRLGVFPDASDTAPGAVLSRRVRELARGNETAQVDSNELLKVLRAKDLDTVFSAIREAESRQYLLSLDEVQLRVDSQFGPDEIEWCVKHGRLPFRVTARLHFARELIQGMITRDLELVRSEMQQRIRDFINSEMEGQSTGWLIGSRREDLARRRELWSDFQRRTVEGQLRPLHRILRHDGGVRIESRFDLTLGVVQTFRRLKNDAGKALSRLEHLCMLLLAHATESTRKGKPVRLSALMADLDCSLGELDSAMGVLHACGVLVNDSLLGRSIELEITTTRRLNQPLLNDRNVKRDFREHQRLGELRLASLDLASHLDSSQQRDLFSRFFACSKSEEIETLLRDFLDDHSNRDRWKNSGELEETERILQEVKQQGLKTGLEDLDENQRRAVLQDPSTHVLLSAGPGSGKTHLLVHRCAWLLLEKELRPSQLLVLAYNRAVALELRSRLRQLFHNLGIRGEGERVPVLTLHSWAARTLRGRTRFMPLDEFHAALNELEIVHPEWIEIWTRSRTGTKARRPILRRIPEGYMVREDLLITREHPDDPGKSVEGVRLPLEMWISWAAWLLESTPGLTKPQHVLLDEVQDLNRERLDLVRSLVPDRSVSLFAVGDPDQSIYGYERRIDGDPMDPIHFLNLLVEHLEQEGGQVSRLTLRRNHRSTAPILEEAHRFQAISGEKRQTSKVAGGMPVRQIQVESEWLPALVDSVFQLVIGENRRLVTDSRDRIGVLFRTNGELLLAQQALLKDERFQNLMQMKAVRVITDRHYEHFYGFREWLLVREALGRLPEYVRPDLVLPQLEILRQEFRKLPGRWNTWAFNAGVALARLLIEDRPNDVSREEYLAELDDLVHEPASMLQALTGTGHKGTSKARPTTIVSLSTIHRAKGLQFDKVILAPTHHELTLMEEDREEERRIQYVARTRAARNLVIIKGPRERAFEENQCYRNPLPQVLVLDSAEKIYLSGMVHEKAFSTVEGLEDHQRFLHEEVRFEAPLLLVGNQLRLVQAEGFQRVVGLISQAFQKNILKHLSCLGLPSFTPMSGLSVGSVIRRELTEDELKFRIHPWIQARGFYWYVMPDGFLEPVPIKDSDDSLAANA